MGRAWFLLFLGACTENTANLADAGVLDANPLDAGFVDSGAPDAEVPDAERVDGDTDAGCEIPAGGDAGDVLTTEGWVRPFRRQGVDEFRSIPFAAPPVGALRWQPPAAPLCHNAPLGDGPFPPQCPQLLDGNVVGNEDCLYLNIFTSNFPRGASKPVLVFIHGGGNAQGSGAVMANGELVYDGAALVRDHGAIVVTLNYRLGALGWLVHPDVAETGNYGLLDQLSALDWVRRNIEKFGGDPNNITIFGESAGARNVCALVAARGPFQRAIMESGACVLPTRAQVATESEAVVAEAGCTADPRACMMALTPEALILAHPPLIDVAGRSSQLQPFPDGQIIPESPRVALAAGRVDVTTMIIGSNRDETSNSVPAVPDATTFEQLVRANFGPTANRVLAAYPLADYPTPRAAYVAITTDVKFGCQARADVRAASQGGVATYRYLFSQNLSAAPRLSALGAYHGLELLFVFNVLHLANYPAPPEELQLAQAMGGYWAHFAQTGDPNDPRQLNQVPWPQHDAQDTLLELRANAIAERSGYRSTQCDLWDSLGL